MSAQVLKRALLWHTSIENHRVRNLELIVELADESAEAEHRGLLLPE